ncbi:hypothetical protein PAAG_12644 [Paracoccidioides lutzii Pb01]|uniref:Uncharacterized protein n=1 Tax=Paracoccidioides lutzii (strain ATCC MYA-826 / Pb01) TaxID=502779 RepID=A0A0A2UZP0_PARBA|nr:hypothetical protein PAAG_12644 [Paracoccidioides lutzii Pb01]KGQ00688.1 hypothetical protein PAAG_12644 [Paracoccidioides lutzii Pb01]
MPADGPRITNHGNVHIHLHGLVTRLVACPSPPIELTSTPANNLISTALIISHSKVVSRDYVVVHTIGEEAYWDMKTFITAQAYRVPLEILPAS